MKIRLLTTLTASALLALPASALAQAGAMPTPGCQGIQITDKAGDNQSQTGGQQGSPSSDVIAGWISYDGSKAFANIQVENLTAGEVDPPWVAIGWEMMMTTTKGGKHVRAYQDRAGVVKYTWGTEKETTDPTPVPSGTTTGALFPGKGGVIQIELPLAEAEFGATPGSVIKSLAIEVRQWGSLPAAVPHISGSPLVYPAPIFDDATGKGSVTLGPCPATPAPGAPGGGPAPAPETPAPGSPSNPGSGSSQADLGVKVTVGKLAAKKLKKKGKKFAIKLSGDATGLTAVVRKKAAGGKTLASGKLATLKGSGKLTLKTKGKLKKGKYVIVLAGKNAQGQAAQTAVNIRVR